MYKIAVTNLPTEEERESDFGPVVEIAKARRLAEELYERLADDNEVAVSLNGKKLWVVSACQERGCCKVTSFEPVSFQGNGGYCAGCLMAFCTDHLTDSDFSKDDGSGQYAELLDDDYCECCVAAKNEPPEPYDY